MNKNIKYMGITAVALLAVAPIAVPVFNSATEITAKADTVNEDTKTNATDTSKVYKTSVEDNWTGIKGECHITGTFPAIKDGKQINISYNSVYVNGKDFDNNEELRMPVFEGYSVDQEYIVPKLQRNPKTNAVTGIILPNGIPTYTKNGSPISSTTESNEAYQMSSILPDNSGQEKLSNSTDITAAQKADAQKWESQMKNSFKVTKDMPLITNDDYGLVYIVGSDGWFRLDASDLTPQTNIFGAFSSDNHNTDEFFMHFNDNKDRSDLYFRHDDNKANNYAIFATATANDGTIKRNLTPNEIDQFLEEKGGKGVTFHFGVHYVENPILGNGTWDQYLGDNSKQVASKDVVVLPPDTDSTNTGSNTNTGSTTNTGSNTNTGNTTNTGSNTNTGTSTNNNTNTSTTTDENKNSDETTTPATSYSSVYTPTTGTELYNDNGTLLTNVGLGKNTAWKVDQKKVVKGVTYLRVATNEWVKVNNGLEIKLIDSVIRTDKQTTLYNSKGEKITNRVLGADTAWRTDRTAQINGQTMYRVATNEWLAAKDVK
ncbi:SLAP domain-containing protein [Companilactobacillus kimchii]|uniref:S-layer protein C-terminal domain-containing protein n=1 Tax=Companilactobacillus kimchii TaxID=2801452 RepID=A0A210P8S4_9LACO|nr:SLAP domain-containing protein [Companilactobacillus kimchii]KAE9561343.1 hypothetical protein ATN91_07855 [Companilactobacillus kimchii]OWF32879.1 uncharacterized protein LKACC12383_01752 [Companilactobacillus kimchii]GEO48435.1 hypothetical protein LKI01_24340 [Companilactobacillus paralimentarius]